MLKLCARLPTEIMTPFGSAVEPDVYCKKAIDSPVEASIATSTTAVLSDTAVVSIHVISGHAAVTLDTASDALEEKENSLEAVSFNADIDTELKYEVWVSAIVAPQLFAVCENAEMYARILRGSGGYTGTAMIPARIQARNVMIKSKDGRNTSSTRSPGLRLQQTIHCMCCTVVRRGRKRSAPRCFSSASFRNQTIPTFAPADMMQATACAAPCPDT